MVRNHPPTLLQTTWSDVRFPLNQYTRRLPDSEAMTVLNNGKEAVTRSIPLREGSLYRDGDRLQDALSGREFVVQDGKLNVELEPKTGLILVSAKA